MSRIANVRSILTAPDGNDGILLPLMVCVAIWSVWYLAVADRPAVQRGYDVPAMGAEIPRP